MLNRKILISNHVIEKFQKRKIKKVKKASIREQILRDLRPLNLREIKKCDNGITKVITKQGKVYVLADIRDNFVLVVTVYKISLTNRYIDL